MLFAFCLVLFANETPDHSQTSKNSLFTASYPPWPMLTSTGANSLEKASSGRVTDFVKANGGHTVITKVSLEHICTVIRRC
jgi:hypothetical protein